MPLQFTSGYATAKAGVIQFARVVGVEYAKSGIGVNTVVPGQLHTPLVDAFLAKDQTNGNVHELVVDGGMSVRCD